MVGPGAGRRAAPQEPVRLCLSGPAPAAEARPRWRVFAARFLGLSEEEADRALARLPLELALLPVDAERLSRALASTGVSGTLEPLKSGLSPCARHPALLAMGTCPRCGGRACGACLLLTPAAACAACARSQSRWTVFRRLRIALLLFVLVVVASQALLDQRRIRSWRRPVRITVHPIVADRLSPEVESYVQSLSSERFQPVAAFLDQEARRHGVAIDPAVAEVEMGATLDELPPPPPESPDISSVALWSLRFRWWVFRAERAHHMARTDVRLFVLYHRDEANRVLEDSVGLAKLRAGIVHAFAADGAEGPNQVVIAHEALHALAASDKYDANGQPIEVLGLGEPGRSPLYPQERAELMSGRVALSAKEARMPSGLSECVIGPETAQEIGWTPSR